MVGVVCTEQQLLDVFKGGQPDQIAMQNLIRTIFAGATPGTTAADEPTAGNVGEEASAEVLQASAAALVTDTAKTIVTLTLTPGDWEVQGILSFLPAATTSITYLSTSISLTTNTHGNNKNRKALASAAYVPGATNIPILETPSVRINVSASTPVYLIGHGVFTVDTLSAFGTLRARRVR